MIASWICVASLVVAEVPPKGYVCVRAREAILVDGKMDDAAWKDAPWTDDFVDIEGDSRPKPRFRTRAKMLWDDRAFYIAAELSEPHVWGTLKEHDSVIFQDNDFEVFLDPDGDNHAYGEIELNALNTEWDLLLKKPYRDGGPAQNEWEIPGLQTAVHVHGSLNDASNEDVSWTVEIAIPWGSLDALVKDQPAAPPRDGDQWRVNFSRVQWRHEVVEGAYRKVAGTREDNWVWSPQGMIDMHQPEHWGVVQFSAEPPGTAVYRPDPAFPARDTLMRVYRAQNAYRARTGTWAHTTAELGFAEEAGESITIRPRDRGYEATLVVEPRDGRPSQTWTIREDSQLSQNPATP